MFSLCCARCVKENGPRAGTPWPYIRYPALPKKILSLRLGKRTPESIWIITEFDPTRHTLEIVKVSPGITVARITIRLAEDDSGNTNAEVEYMYTAISREGEEFVRGYSQEFFDRFMQFSESALNSFLNERRRRKTAGADLDRLRWESPEVEWSTTLPYSGLTIT